MNKELERYLIIFLLLMLIGLSGCMKKIISTSNNVKLPDTVSEPLNEESSSVQNIPGIVNALTCMFSPDTCESVKQEQKMDR
jgi:PBP1b-binding outer membrane lipoprotein LpoB